MVLLHDTAFQYQVELLRKVTQYAAPFYEVRPPDQRISCTVLLLVNMTSPEPFVRIAA